MWAGLEPLDLGQLSSPSPASLLRITPTLPSPKTLHLGRASACPGTGHLSSAASPLLSQPHFGLHTYLATQDKSVPLAIQPWGQIHLCSQKSSQNEADSEERRWAECPVSDAKPCQFVARLEFTWPKTSEALSLPRLSYFYFS